ncbi:TetR/AcrR family transcriptional regulator, partial [Burkholderia cenocepacia]
MAVGTRDALVQAGEGLMRSMGYAAFSYADLAETVGIRKASIHHHFPTKEDLGVAIVEA